MAPRERIKKRGNLRIDAALDAMNPFGFHPKLVRDTVKELLSVYGGDEGWVFIEEGSYTLLIDTLLEKRKDGAIEKVHEEDGRIADLQETSEAGCSSNVVNEASTSNPGAEITVKPTEGVISSYVDNEPFRITATVPANDSDERYWKEEDIGSGVADNHFIRSSMNQSLLAAHTPKIRRRKPYHGWISSSGDDREDLVHLTPAQLPEEFARKQSHLLAV
ncbi:uncharacterized protein LOC111793562 isoform X2 [Cucurbita pepo subsp. pepo]|uniref:uncharacterized protein LOC111786513 n=1 Tax=Cucurbita pepo subsp. pepo TaxID=3664 RepID=UPI000C9DA56C|nr:uncharacterized protein LOC111786513 [Cucurbita pepo subsp. pepo]XP_023531282.1 uncharacterized protein LOC111793562 isoform X2 [Cucurbita pepo subsp. pepo]